MVEYVGKVLVEHILARMVEYMSGLLVETFIRNNGCVYEWLIGVAYSCNNA